jgi:hypothetical protein
MKQVGHEADNLPTTNDKYKDEWSYDSNPTHMFPRCATQLSKETTLPLPSIQIIETIMALIISSKMIREPYSTILKSFS